MKTKSLDVSTSSWRLGDKSFVFQMANQVIVFVLAFIFSNARVLGIMAPFNIAVTAALPVNLSYISFLGSLMGYVFFGGISSNISAIFCMFLIIVAKQLFIKSQLLKYNILGVSFLSVGITFLIEGLNLVIIGINISGILFVLSESLLVGSMTYFTFMCFNCINKGKFLGDLNIFEKSSFIILFGLFILSTTGIGFFFMSLGNIIGILAILTMAYKYGVVGASISGIVVAMAITLYNPNLIYLASGFVVAGFLSSIFNKLGKFLMVSVFMIVNSVAFILLSNDISIFSDVVDIFLSSIIFLMIPEKVFEFISINKTEKNYTGVINANNSISSKLKFASNTISDLQLSVESVSKKIDGLNTQNVSNIFHETANKVCKSCVYNMQCWDKNYNETINALDKTIECIKIKKEITKFDLPVYFQQKCRRIELLVSVINLFYDNQISKQISSKNSAEMRYVAMEQFDAMSNMLFDISDEISDITRVDYEKQEKVRKLFENKGYQTSDISVLFDKYGRISVDVYLSNSYIGDLKIITEELSDSLARDLEIPSIIRLKDNSKMSFFEKANYSIDFCSKQYAIDKTNICGDSYEFFVDSRGCANLILSDGMGSGKKAAIDSMMTCSLILKLIKAGFGFSTAIKLINSSLLIKSKEESLATLDITTIDLYTGKVKFNKAGGCTSFLYKGGRVLKFEGNSLPIGILNGAAFDSQNSSIDNNSILVMVSDGVLSTGVEWIEMELKLYKKQTAEEICSVISREAKRRLHKNDQDDITVMVAKFGKLNHSFNVV